MKKELKRFILRFTQDIGGLLPAGKIAEQDKGYYLADESTRSLVSEIEKNSGLEPRHQGTYLGNIRKNRFSPSFLLLDLLFENIKEKNIVKVDKKAYWLFMCGKDIFKNSIQKYEIHDPKKLCFVLGPAGDLAGIGKIVGDPGSLSPGRLAIKNVLDRGIFLRQEMTR